MSSTEIIQQHNPQEQLPLQQLHQNDDSDEEEVASRINYNITTISNYENKLKGIAPLSKLSVHTNIYEESIISPKLNQDLYVNDNEVERFKKENNELIN